MADIPLITIPPSKSVAYVASVRPAIMLRGISSPFASESLERIGYPVTMTGFRNNACQQAPLGFDLLFSDSMLVSTKATLKDRPPSFLLSSLGVQ
jgi:hypothetical protein